MRYICTNILISLILIPFIGAIFLNTLNEEAQKQFKVSIAFRTRARCLPLSCIMWIIFNYSTQNYQFRRGSIVLVGNRTPFALGIDGISLCFILLSSLLIPLCIISSSVRNNLLASQQYKSTLLKKSTFKLVTNLPNYSAGYYSAFLIIQRLVTLVFATTNILTFYIAFEAVLIPMYLIIGIYGSRARRTKASFIFFLYTLGGSLIILVGILWLYNSFGTLEFQVLQILIRLNNSNEHWLWLAFFIGFAVKVPIFPWHLWLPEAHVEAPTAASVLLAGILLKLGTYGIIRCLLRLLPAASVYFTPLVLVVRTISVIYASLNRLRQRDIKRVIAYSSIAHINLTVIGLFTATIQGVEGALLQIFSHGIVSGGLFLCIGIIYDRYHTRLIKNYSGLYQIIPIFGRIFLFLTIARIALPGTSSFVGEYLIFQGSLNLGIFLVILNTCSIVLCGCYALWLYNRIFFGNLHKEMQLAVQLSDITALEITLLVPLIILTVFLGVYPSPLLEILHARCINFCT